jgi:hypothetical protein
MSAAGTRWTRLQRLTFSVSRIPVGWTCPAYPASYLVCCSLQVLFRSGAVQRLKLAAWPSKLPPATPLWQSVDTSNVFPILAILGAGLLASLLLLILERLVARWHQH